MEISVKCTNTKVFIYKTRIFLNVKFKYVFGLNSAKKQI